jgi:5-methylcytosine-specific restriction endonuclease McrA
VNVPSAEDQIRFLVRVQRILDEGSFVSTYKFALLLALAQVSIERGDDSGRPLTVTTRELAEHFVRHYWRQVVPFVPADGRTAGRVLKQNTGDLSAILRRIESARRRFDGSLSALVRSPKAWGEILASVARIIEVMPLWKLQTVGREKLEFLYGRGPTRHQIVLEPGVAYCFRRFHPLIQDLVQAAWIRFVRRVKANQDLVGGGNELGDFLFGSERSVLAAFQPILADVQQGRCFYCRRPLGGRGAVDHFIPWSRYAFDLGHNFVLAHDGCNAKKSDRLAAVEHLERWCERNVEQGAVLAERFDEKSLVHDLPASREITRWAYAQAEQAAAQVWDEGDRLVALERGWHELL